MCVWTRAISFPPRCLLTKPSCALSHSAQSALSSLSRSLSLCPGNPRARWAARRAWSGWSQGLQSNVLISCDANRLLLPPQPCCYSGPALTPLPPVLFSSQLVWKHPPPSPAPPTHSYKRGWYFGPIPLSSSVCQTCKLQS